MHHYIILVVGLGCAKAIQNKRLASLNLACPKNLTAGITRHVWQKGANKREWKKR